MIDVYICEDNQEQRKVIVQYIRSAILIEEYEMELKLESPVYNFLIFLNPDKT